MLENSPPASTEDWDRSHGFPWRHKSHQSHAKNVMQFQNRYLKCPVALNDRGPSGKWPWWRLRDLGPSLAYIGWCKAWWDDDLIGSQLENRWHQPTSDPFTSRPCWDFIEMHPTVTHESLSSSGKGVTRHVKISLKTKIIFSKSPGVTN